jgi:hypothetical protein
VLEPEAVAVAAAPGGRTPEALWVILFPDPGLAFSFYELILNKNTIFFPDKQRKNIVPWIL